MSYEVVAFNTATLSDNKIHDDEVASRFGFTGGLVPGVDVYAYLTHPPAEAWGRARAVEVADEEDRAIVESDFARLEPVLG